MTGEQRLEPDEFIQSKVLAVIERVNNEWDKIGLLLLDKPKGIEPLLHADEGYIKSLTREECGNKAFILSQYALYLQKEENKLKAIVEFLENALATVVGKEAQNYGDKFVRYEHKRDMVIGHNSYANKLNKELSKYNQNLSSLGYFSTRVQKMSDRLVDIANTKRQNYVN